MVFFNEPKTLKENEISQALSIDKNKSPILDIIEGEIGHYSFGDKP
jgi:hypothetical protein